MMINGPFTKIKGLSDIRRLPRTGKISSSLSIIKLDSIQVKKSLIRHGIPSRNESGERFFEGGYITLRKSV